MKVENYPGCRAVAMRRMLCFLGFGALAGAGCTIEKPPDPIPQTALDNGYAIIYELLSKEAQADKILWVKIESDGLDKLMGEISTACGEGRDKLIELYGKSPGIPKPALPSIEAETRKKIEAETGSDLLKSSGVDFEAKLILTQLESLRYSTHLCLVISEKEKKPAHRKFLEQFAEKSANLRVKALNLLFETLSKPKGVNP